MRRTFIYDAEADGLLHTVTKVHCVVLKEYLENCWAIFVAGEDIECVQHHLTQLATKNELQEFTPHVLPFTALADVCNCRIVCHNQLGFDLDLLKKMFQVDWMTENEPIDSLVMSRYLYSNNRFHSLDWWGEQLTKQKIPIDDWSDLPLEEYLHRCVRDILINELLYTHLREQFTDERLIDGFPLAQRCYRAMVEQERTGAVFDADYAREILEKIQAEMTEIAAEVEPQFGEAPLPKSQQPTFPKKPFKKDGSLSVSAQRYGVKIGITDPAALQADIQRGPRLLTQKITLDNMAHVKEYLFKQGWKPTIWRTNNITQKDKTRESKETIRKRAAKYVKDIWRDSPYRETIWEMLDIPEYLRTPYDDLTPPEHRSAVLVCASSKNNRELPMSPQTHSTSASGKTICPNLEKMEGMSDTITKILRWMSLKNRRGVIDGWLNHPRLSVDGRLPAGSSGWTNTFREKHCVVVNVPKADPKVVFGREMRSMFIAPEGYVCVGADASGIENRVSGHFTYPYDDGAYARGVLSGDTHTVNAKRYSELIGREVTRSDGKGITYAALYGASPKKIAVMLDIPLEVAKAVWAAFWEINPGLRLYKEDLIEEWLENGKEYIYGIDGRRIGTRSQHSIVNASFQSCGAIIMNRAWVIAEDERLSKLPKGSWARWGYHHDEYQMYARPEVADEVGQAIVYGIEAAGRRYNMNLPLTGEYKTGRTWKDTH